MEAKGFASEPFKREELTKMRLTMTQNPYPRVIPIVHFAIVRWAMISELTVGAKTKLSLKNTLRLRSRFYLTGIQKRLILPAI
jgi:hypothetical protein